MGYRMKGSPAKLGKIQGTSGHASALKQMSEFELGKEAESIMRDLKDFKTNLKKDKKKDPSEKTKRLRGETKLQDFKTEEHRKRSVRAQDREGKYGKGLFGGYFRRKKVERKHEKSGKKEDKLRRQLEKSERYDQMTPAEKQAFDDSRQAKLLAMFHGDAGSMKGIAQQQYNQMKQKDSSKKASNVQAKNVIASKTNLGDSNKIYQHKGYDVGASTEDKSTLGKIIDKDTDLDKHGNKKSDYDQYVAEWKKEQSGWGKK